MRMGRNIGNGYNMEPRAAGSSDFTGFTPLRRRPYALGMTLSKFAALSFMLVVTALARNFLGLGRCRGWTRIGN